MSVSPAAAGTTSAATAQYGSWTTGAHPTTGGYGTTYSAGGYGATTPGQAPPGQPPGKGGSKITTILVYTIAAFLIAIGGGVVGGLLVGAQNTQSGNPDGKTTGDTAEMSLPDMAEAVRPSVVSIETRSSAHRTGGSGVVISEDGLILTNHHVIEDADEIEVTFHNGESEEAEVVEEEPDLDLAVIKLTDPVTVTPAKLGDSSKLRVGETVVAIGSPLGLEGSVTAGIVSGLNRTIPAGERGDEEIEGVIQTDAAINPGNSGGPLLNARGEVVGINTAIATTSEQGGNIGLGFAVPINAARDLIAEAANTD